MLYLKSAQNLAKLLKNPNNTSKNLKDPKTNLKAPEETLVNPCQGGQRRLLLPAADVFEGAEQAVDLPLQLDSWVVTV